MQLEENMDKSSRDAGTIQVLLNRLNEQRLPHALALKEKVDRGEQLDDYDIQFLKDVFADAQGAIGLADNNPEFQPLVARLMSLYSEITSKAVENQPKDLG
jgi:hypothetical protein